MLQDIAPHTYHVEFTPAEPQPADLLLIYGPQGVLSAADALRLPRRADFPDIAVHFAFRLDDRAVFLAREPVEAPEGWPLPTAMPSRAKRPSPAPPVRVCSAGMPQTASAAAAAHS